MSSPETTIIKNSSWTATDIIAWVTFIILIIFIIIIIFFYFLRPSTVVTQVEEFYAANYQYAPTNVNTIPTNGNFIYIIPQSTPVNTIFTIQTNTANNPGRTFLIKNDSSVSINLTAATGATLVLINGNVIAAGVNDILTSNAMAMYITDETSPNTVFRRLF
jgi:hypothetical protein